MGLLDARTIIFSHGLIDIVCLLVILLLWHQSRKRFAGTGFWVLHFVFQTAAMFLILLRGSIPDWMSMVLSNTLVIAGAILGYVGLVRFVGEKVSQVHNYVLLAAFACVHAYFTLVQPSLAARILNLSVGLLIICFQRMWFLLYGVKPGMRRFTFGVAMVNGAYCLVSIVRIVGFFTGTLASNDFFRAGAFESLILMAYQMMFIIFTYSLVLMVNKRLLVEVKTEEEKFAKAFRSSPYAIMLTRLSDGQIFEVNDGFLNTCGYQYADAIGKTTVDLHLWGREEDRLVAVNELSKTGKVQGREFQFRKKSGEIMTGIFSAEIIPINNQEFILSSINDITERKRMEEALRQSEERFRAVFESSSDCILVWDRQCNYLYANQAAIDHVGTTRDKVIGKNIRDGLGHIPDFMHLWMARVEQAFATGQPFRVEDSVLVGGRLVYSESQISPIRDASGQAFAVSVVYRDVTERKRAAETLRKAHDELEVRVQERTAEIKKQAELIELSHDAILAMDLENRIIFWSRGAEEVYGWRKEEVLGKIIHTVLETEFPVPLPEIITELIEKGRWDGELSQFRRDGQKIDVLSRWAVQRDGSGEAVAILEINIDITERKKVEEQLRQAHKMEALGTLAGGIVHDFNNLLSPILLNTEMALMDVKDGVLPSAESMKMVITGAKRGKELVQQIITFSRHKGEELRPVDIAAITKETIRFLRSAIPSTVRFETRIEDPSGPVLANPAQIHQILLNLVNNAAHAMAEEGILEISLKKVEKGVRDGMNPDRYICLTVRDTGHGMSPEIKERAFDPFFTTKAPGKGTGMGLAVVHGIVKKHRGEIRLESEVGKGTAVSVFLPVYQGPKKEEILSPVPALLTGNENILLIDDEEVQTRTVEAMLKRLGYRVFSETDPRKALEAFRAKPDAFDLVITDQAMPYVPGNRLSQEILTIRPKIPIILCTGFSETVDEESAAALGITGYIQKPFTLNDISDLIRRALSK